MTFRLRSFLILIATTLGLAAAGSPIYAQENVKICIGEKSRGCIKLHPGHPRYNEVRNLWNDLSEGELPWMAYPNGNPWNMIDEPGDVR